MVNIGGIMIETPLLAYTPSQTALRNNGYFLRQ